MEEVKTEQNQSDMVALANEMTLRSFRWNQMNLQKIFQNMSSLDYTAMWILSRHIEEEEKSRKIYLKDISEKMELPMPRVSAMVRELQDRGLVYWKHDGKGENGTYIQITEHGMEKALEQQDKLKDFYKKVVEKFGKERFVELLGEMAELEDIMNCEINKIDAAPSDR